MSQYYYKRRKLTFLLLLVRLLLLIILSTSVDECQGSRINRQVFKLNPNTNYSGSDHFLWFKPRRIPIPVSGPSRKHNDIGLQSWNAPWRFIFFFNKRWLIYNIYIYMVFLSFLVISYKSCMIIINNLTKSV